MVGLGRTVWQPALGEENKTGEQKEAECAPLAPNSRFWRGSLSVGPGHVAAEMGIVKSVGFWYLTYACGVLLSGGSSTALSLCPSITEGFHSGAVPALRDVQWEELHLRLHSCRV